ncbi:MAG: 50S ribosomal protein L17 [Porphyromonas sp.]|nr:50S ribosomal protein L17 [Porphyromonas sp.]
MRHNKKHNKLTRTAAHRDAMLSNMASSLIMEKRINTTLPKAKALRVYVEPLITKSRENTTHSRRVVFSQLQNKYAVTELFDTVAPKVGDRPGGYTRILKLGKRQGDDAMMCLIELVDFNEDRVKEEKKSASGKKTRRSRRGSGSSKSAEAAKKAAVNNEVATEAEASNAQPSSDKVEE